MGIRNLLSSDCTHLKVFYLLSVYHLLSGHEIIVLSQLLTTMKSLDLKDFRSHSRSCFFLSSECKQLFYCILLNAFWSYQELALAHYLNVSPTFQKLSCLAGVILGWQTLEVCIITCNMHILLLNFIWCLASRILLFFQLINDHKNIFWYHFICTRLWHSQQKLLYCVARP